MYVFNDEFSLAPEGALKPFESTLMEALLRDSSYKFIDDISTPAKESISNMVTKAFKGACLELNNLKTSHKLEWAKYKDTHIDHLTKLPAFSRLHLPIGGGEHIINATKAVHGPSWRMVVSLTPQTEAYGIYPGGQNGNPGSKFYDNGIDKWVQGEYYTLWVMTKNDINDNRVKSKIVFKRG